MASAHRYLVVWSLVVPVVVVRNVGWSGRKNSAAGRRAHRRASKNPEQRGGPGHMALLKR